MPTVEKVQEAVAKASPYFAAGKSAFATGKDVWSKLGEADARMGLAGTHSPSGSQTEAMGKWKSAMAGWKKAKEWEKAYKTFNEWSDRTDNYLNPDKRVAQSIRDLTAAPELLLKAFGIAADEFPFFSWIKADVEFFGNFLIAYLDVTKAVELAKGDWSKAVSLAKKLNQDLEKDLKTSRKPSDDRDVKFWNSVIDTARYHPDQIYLRGYNIHGGFYSQGFEDVRAHMNQARLSIAVSAREYYLVNMMTRAQRLQIKLLTGRTEALRIQYRTGNLVQQLAGVGDTVNLLNALKQNLDYLHTVDADPLAYTEANAERVADFSRAWLHALYAVAHWRPIAVS